MGCTNQLLKKDCTSYVKYNQHVLQDQLVWWQRLHLIIVTCQLVGFLASNSTA